MPNCRSLSRQYHYQAVHANYIMYLSYKTVFTQLVPPLSSHQLTNLPCQTVVGESKQTSDRYNSSTRAVWFCIQQTCIRATNPSLQPLLKPITFSSLPNHLYLRTDLQFPLFSLYRSKPFDSKLLTRRILHDLFTQEGPNDSLLSLDDKSHQFNIIQMLKQKSESSFILLLPSVSCVHSNGVLDELKMKTEWVHLTLQAISWNSVMNIKS